MGERGGAPGRTRSASRRAGSGVVTWLPYDLTSRRRSIYNPLMFRTWTAVALLAGAACAHAAQPRNAASEAEARKVIEAYFPLFSKRDVKGLLRVVNFPHIRVTAAKTVTIP